VSLFCVFSKVFAWGATFEVNDDARLGSILEACVWGVAWMRIRLNLHMAGHYKRVLNTQNIKE
jgi:hypothetical protein